MKNKIIALFIVLLLSTVSSTSVYAETENVNVSTSIPGQESGGITTYSASRPQDFVVLTSMSFSGKAEETSLYLNKGFTGVSSAKVVIHNYSSSTLTIKVRKNATFFPVVETHTISANNYNGSFVISGLSKNAEYYLEFCAPCNFSGTISSAS